MKKRKNQNGISIAEVLIAIGLFSLTAAGIILLVTDAYDLSRFSAERNVGQALADEGMEAAESIRARAWNELTYGTHGLDESLGYWAFSGTEDDLDPYTRTTTVSEVYRDAGGDIVEVGGSLDPQTKKVTVSVTWTFAPGRDQDITLEKYFTLWESADWTQTTQLDFAAGTDGTTLAAAVYDDGHVQLPGYVFDYIESSVGMYHFDEGTGADVFDRSGKGKNGTANNTNWVPGKYYDALEFNGSDSYVRVPDNGAQEPPVAISVELWMNLDAISDDWLVEKHTSTPDDYDHGYVLRTNTPTNTVSFRVGNGSAEGTAESPDNSIGTGAWHHVAGTYDGEKVRIFVDGVLEGESEFAGDIDYSGVGDLFIGASSQNTLNTDGDLDEVAIYNRVLTPSEVRDHYENGILENRLRLHLDESSGTTATDGSAYEFDLEANTDSWTTGRFGNAFDTDGGNNYIGGTGGLKMEAGVANTDENWLTVNLNNTYDSPVVIATMHEDNNGQSPASVRVRNVGNSSFDVKLDYPPDNYPPVVKTNDDIYYFVIEEGDWTLPDGTLIEAHLFDTSVMGYKGNWGSSNMVQQTYSHSYGSDPLVLTQVQTDNDTDWITTWTSQYGSKNDPPASSSVQAALNGAEAYITHGMETIGWVAMDNNVTSSIGAIDYETQITPRNIRGHGNGCFTYNYNNSYGSAPILIGQQLGMRGGDGGWLVVCSNSSSQAGFHIEEDQTSDSDRNHTQEVGGFLAVEGAFDYSEGGSAADPEAIDLTEELTVSGWIYREADSGNYEVLAVRSDNLGSSLDYGLYIDNNDKLVFGVSNDGTFANRTEAVSDQSIELDRWYFVTGSYDGSELKVYVNGALDASPVSFAAGAHSSDYPLFISSSAYPFDGLIDEVRIYNRGLNDAQVYGLFKKSTELVGQWHMNEASWNGTPGEVKDSSGFGNDGTGENGADTTSDGRFDDGGNLDGNDDYVSVPDAASLNMVNTGTIELWFKTASDWTSQGNDHYLINKSGNPGFGAYLGSGDGKVNFFLSESGGTTHAITGDDRVSDGQWHHLAAMWGGQGMKMYIDGGLQAGADAYNGSWIGNFSDLAIGAQTGGGSHFEGAMDEVNIWSRLLSAAEVLQRYGDPPVGWWRLADNGGASTYDNGPYSNDGGLQPGGSEPLWVDGKFGSALKFDGTDDRVAISNDAVLNPTDSITLEAWTDFSGSGGLQNILTNGAWNRALRVGGDTFWNPNKFIFQLTTGGSDHTLYSDAISAWGDWHHVAGTYDGATVKLFVDGRLAAQEDASGGIVAATADTFVGAESGLGYFYNGTIDEPRVWDRALSDSEVWERYVYGLYGSYATAGTFMSAQFDTGAPSSYNTLYWEESRTQSHNLRMQVRTATDRPSLGGAAWYGSAGAGTYFTDPEETQMSSDHNGDQWAQYQCLMDSDGTSTPELNLTRINYTQQ